MYPNTGLVPLLTQSPLAQCDGCHLTGLVPLLTQSPLAQCDGCHLTGLVSLLNQGQTTVHDNNNEEEDLYVCAHCRVGQRRLQTIETDVP